MPSRSANECPDTNHRGWHLRGDPIRDPLLFTCGAGRRGAGSAGPGSVSSGPCPRAAAPGWPARRRAGTGGSKWAGPVPIRHRQAEPARPQHARQCHNLVTGPALDCAPPSRRARRRVRRGRPQAGPPRALGKPLFFTCIWSNNTINHQYSSLLIMVKACG